MINNSSRYKSYDLSNNKKYNMYNYFNPFEYNLERKDKDNNKIIKSISHDERCINKK